jgi:hypothetical protein
LLNVVLRMIARSSPSAKAQATLAAMPVVTLVVMLAVTPVVTLAEMLAATLVATPVEMLAAPPTLLQHLLPLPLRQPPLPVTPVETPVAMLVAMPVAMLETTPVPELPRHPLLRPSKRPLLLVARTRLDAVVAEVAEAASDADEDDLLRATTLHDLANACDDYGQMMEKGQSRKTAVPQ